MQRYFRLFWACRQIKSTTQVISVVAQFRDKSDFIGCIGKVATEGVAYFARFVIANTISTVGFFPTLLSV